MISDSPWSGGVGRCVVPSPGKGEFGDYYGGVAYDFGDVVSPFACYA